MPFFRKKPVVIEAHNYVGVYSDFLKAWLGDAAFWSDQQTLNVITLEGPVTVSRGDWIIKGVKGEFYPCKPDIFKQTYEVADAPDPDRSQARQG